MEFQAGDQVVLENLRQDIHQPGVVKDVMQPMLGQKFIVKEAGQWLFLEDDPHGYMYAKEWFIPAGKKFKRKKPKKATKKGIAFLVAEVRKELRKRAGTGCANYGLVIQEENGTLSKQVQINDICHARMRVYGVKRKVVAAVDFIGKPHERFTTVYAYKKYLRYADYIINRSAARHAFIPCNMNTYKQHGVKVNVDVSATAVMYGLVALRVGNEKQWVIHTFDLLCNLGYSEGFAFLMANSFKPASNVNVAKTHWNFQMTGNHTPIDASMSLKAAKKIADNSYEFPKGSYKDKPTDWQIFETLRAKKGGDSWGLELRSWIEKNVGGKEVWGTFQNEPMTSKQFNELCQHMQATLHNL